MNGICASIKVDNLEKSIEFYINGLGYKEAKRLYPNNMELVFLSDDNNGLLELINDKQAAEREPGSKVSIVISIENLEDTLSHLSTLGYKPETGPIRVPSGEYIAFIHDPDGIEVELIQGFPAADLGV